MPSPTVLLQKKITFIYWVHGVAVLVLSKHLICSYTFDLLTFFICKTPLFISFHFLYFAFLLSR